MRGAVAVAAEFAPKNEQPCRSHAASTVNSYQRVGHETAFRAPAAWLLQSPSKPNPERDERVKLPLDPETEPLARAPSGADTPPRLLVEVPGRGVYVISRSG